MSAGGLRQTLSRALSLQDATEGIRDISRVLRLCKKTVFAVPYHIWNPGDATGHHRQPGSHALQEHVGQAVHVALGPHRWHGQRIRRPVQRRHPVPGHGSEEIGERGNPDCFRQVAEVRLLVSRAREEKVSGDSLIP